MELKVENTAENAEQNQPTIREMIEFVNANRGFNDMKETVKRSDLTSQVFYTAQTRKDNKFTAGEIKIVTVAYKVVCERIERDKILGIAS